MPVKIGLDTSFIMGLVDDKDVWHVALVEQTGGELNFNDTLIALACGERGIDYLASFDADFDRVAWLKRIARPDQVP